LEDVGVTRSTGLLVRTEPELGYGFAVSDSDGEVIFVHRKDIPEYCKTSDFPALFSQLSFVIVAGKPGHKRCGASVEVLK
jgi:hypothetical protein